MEFVLGALPEIRYCHDPTRFIPNSDSHHSMNANPKSHFRTLAMRIAPFAAMWLNCAAQSLLPNAPEFPVYNTEDKRGLGFNDPLGTLTDFYPTGNDFGGLGVTGTGARYGNWLGPKWWGGSELEGRCGIMPPVDSLDALAQRHDMAYAVAEEQGRLHNSKAEEYRLKAMADHIAARDARNLDPDPTKWAHPPQDPDTASRYQARLITSFKYEEGLYLTKALLEKNSGWATQTIHNTDALDKAVDQKVNTWQDAVDQNEKRKEELKKPDDKKPDDKKPDDKKPDDKKPETDKKSDTDKEPVVKALKPKKKPVPPKKPDPPKKIPVAKKELPPKKPVLNKTPEVKSSNTVVDGGSVSDKSGKTTVTYTKDKNGNDIKITYTTYDSNGKVIGVKSYGANGKLIPNNAPASKAAKDTARDAIKNTLRHSPPPFVCPGGHTG